MTRPVALPVFAMFMLMASLVLDVETWVGIGAFDKSLNSDLPNVRDWALFTINATRAILAASGLALLAIFVAWPLIVRSSLAAHYRTIIERPAVKSYSPAGGVGWAILLFVLLIVAIAYIAVGDRFLSPGALEFINREDGLVEQLSVVACIAAAILSLRSIRWLGDDSLQRLTRIAIAIAFIMMAGEEISWGQRILGFETPDELKKVNVQGETNLHNSFGYLADHLFIASVFAYGFFLPLLSSISRVVRRTAGVFALPIAPIALAIIFLLVSLLHDWTVNPLFGNGAGIRVAEVRELLTLMAFVALMHIDLQRLRRSDTSCPDG